MGYALFAQRKITLTGQLNSVSLQQTQRSNEQYLLASDTLSLQQQMTSLQSAQSLELSDLYKLLSYSSKDGGFESALEDGETTNDTYEELLSIASKYDLTSTADRDQINAKIKEKESDYQAELDDINRDIYVVSVKENAIEMEVERLDTQVTSLQKQLEAIEEAESDAIDRATPKFNGVG